MINPDDSGAQRFNYAERFIDIAGPDGGSEPVGRVVGDTNGFGFVVKGDYAGNGTEDFFASDARGVFDVVKNGRLEVVASAELFRAATTGGDFGFFFADLEIRTDAVVLLFADQRAHLGVTVERTTELDALGFFGHGLDEFGVDFLLDEDAAASGANFALIDKDSEERAVDSGFPIRFGKENVGRLAAEFKGDALEGIGGALDDDFSHGGAAGERDFVHAGMRDERGASRFTESVDDVDHAGWYTGFLEIIGELQCGEWSLLRRFEDASAARG